jgi:hypothetical protein
MQQRTIIDGQQRLTTLQLLLDALHAELLFAEQVPSAMRLEPLTANAEPFCPKPEDRFKVWPTNRSYGRGCGSVKPPEEMLIAHRKPMWTSPVSGASWPRAETRKPTHLRSQRNDPLRITSLFRLACTRRRGPRTDFSRRTIATRCYHAVRPPGLPRRS